MNELMGVALSRVVQQTGCLGALAPLWRTVVGELAGRHSRPLRLEGSTLVIACDAPAWREVLVSEAPRILARLRRAMGQTHISRLVFEVE